VQYGFYLGGWKGQFSGRPPPQKSFQERRDRILARMKTFKRIRMREVDQASKSPPQQQGNQVSSTPAESATATIEKAPPLSPVIATPIRAGQTPKARSTEAQWVPEVKFAYLGYRQILNPNSGHFEAEMITELMCTTLPYEEVRLPFLKLLIEHKAAAKMNQTENKSPEPELVNLTDSDTEPDTKSTGPDQNMKATNPPQEIETMETTDDHPVHSTPDTVHMDFEPPMGRLAPSSQKSIPHCEASVESPASPVMTGEEAQLADTPHVGPTEVTEGERRRQRRRAKTMRNRSNRRRREAADRDWQQSYGDWQTANQPYPSLTTPLPATHPQLYVAHQYYQEPYAATLHHPHSLLP
jgi:hypothetical protein